MKAAITCVCLAFAIVLSLVGIPVSNVQAAHADVMPTVLVIESLAPLRLGQHPIIVVRLITSEGLPVIGEPIELFLDGLRQRRERTDYLGVATFTIRRNLVAGSHALQAIYNGSQTLAASNTLNKLTVQPWELSIRTVPALAGVRFALDGHVFSSDASGIAHITIERVANYRLEILTTNASEADIRWSFQRWEADVFVPLRRLQFPSAKSIEVGFNVSYHVKPAFIDLAKHAVDATRITAFTLKNSLGGVDVFDDGQPQWLQANRVLRHQQGIEEVKILYSVESVIIDGSNIVNQSQQRFYANRNDEWPIQLLLYKTRFTARDALFGFPIGKSIHLESPDGSVQDIAFGPGADVTVRSLVRGIYRVHVVGAPGLKSIAPVAQSRDQEVNLLVVSYLDLALVVLILAVFGLGLLFTGRPQLLVILRDPRGMLVMAIRAATALPTTLRSMLKQQSWRRHSIPVLQPATTVPVVVAMQPAASAVLAEREPQANVLPMQRRREPTLLFAVALVMLGVIGGVAGLDIGVPSTGPILATLVQTGFGEGVFSVLRMLAVLVLGLFALLVRWHPNRTSSAAKQRATSDRQEPLNKRLPTEQREAHSNPRSPKPLFQAGSFLQFRTLLTIGCVVILLSLVIRAVQRRTRSY